MNARNAILGLGALCALSSPALADQDAPPGLWALMNVEPAQVGVDRNYKAEILAYTFPSYEACRVKAAALERAEKVVSVPNVGAWWCIYAPGLQP
jgi:hypothetical protein